MKEWDINMNNGVLWLKRRLLSPDIQGDMKETVEGCLRLTKPLGYRSAQVYFDDIMDIAVFNFINHWEELYNADDRTEIKNYVRDVMTEMYRDIIINHYKKYAY
jgi:hypothetical protein